MLSSHHAGSSVRPGPVPWLLRPSSRDETSSLQPTLRWPDRLWRHASWWWVPRPLCRWPHGTAKVTACWLPPNDANARQRRAQSDWDETWWAKSPCATSAQQPKNPAAAQTPGPAGRWHQLFYSLTITTSWWHWNDLTLVHNLPLTQSVTTLKQTATAFECKKHSVILTTEGWKNLKSHQKSCLFLSFLSLNPETHTLSSLFRCQLSLT